MTGLTATQQAALAATGSFSWTADTTTQPFRPVAFSALVDRVISLLDSEHIVVPNAEQFVRRAVAGLLAGHIILQGPPGQVRPRSRRYLPRHSTQNYESSLRRLSGAPMT